MCLDNIINEFMKGHALDFVSEKDFQVELAIAIKTNLRDSEVICEYPVETNVEYDKENKNRTIKRGYIDIVVKKGDILYPVELKYRTKQEELSKFNGVKLKNQGAYDTGCYGFLRDICRVEEFLKKNKNNEVYGYAIFLTNDEKYSDKYNGRDGELSFKEFWLGDEGPKYLENGTVGRVSGRNRRLDLPENINDIKELWQKKSNRNYILTKIDNSGISSK